jgi:DNA repair photolyase
VLIAPILPGLSDDPEQLKAVVEACVAAGAVSISAISLHLRPGVREHYLAWLRQARPDLEGLYEERFSGRSGLRAYQPKAVQEALSAHVRRLVLEAEGRYDGARAVRVVDGDDDLQDRLAAQGIGRAAPHVQPAEPATQLSLL